MINLKRVLVPVDFSSCSRAALEYAARVAAASDATLEILHVYEPPHYIGDVMVQIPERAAVTVQEYIRQQSESLLADLLRSATGLEGLSTTTTMRPGVPHAAVVEQARASKSDLIVMGTHGRSGLSHLLMGSVAEKVLRQAPCPVVVVRDQYPSS